MPPIRSRRGTDPGPYVRETALLPRDALPYRIQHTLLTAVQKILEEAIFYFVQKWYPPLLQQQGWDTPEAGELNKWWNVLSAPFHRVILPAATQFHAGGLHISELFSRLSHLRHASVHRVVTSIESIKKMMIDSVELADVLKDFTRRNKLRCIELAILDADLESLQRVTQQPLEMFVDFNYPGCLPGSTCDTARRAPQYALEAPRTMAPMFPAAPIVPVPAPVGKVSRHKRKKSALPLPAGSGKSHPASNTHSQVRVRDRYAPYPIVRDFIKKSVGHLIDLTGDGEIDLGLVGASKNNPVDLTIDSEKNMEKSQPTTVKVSSKDEFQGNQDFIPLANLKCEAAPSGVYLATPAGSESPGGLLDANNTTQAPNTRSPFDRLHQQKYPKSATRFGDSVQQPATGKPFSQIQAKPADGFFRAPNTEQAQNASIPFGQQQQYPQSATRLTGGNFVQQAETGGVFSQIQAKAVDGLFRTPNIEQAQNISSPFGQQHHQQQPKASAGFGGIVGGKGLYCQNQVNPTGSVFGAPSGSQFSVGAQQPAATGGLSLHVSENHRPNAPANSMGVNTAAKNPQTAQGQPFFTQILSIAKRAPNAIINRFRTPSPRPESHFVSALRQTSGNVPGSFPLSSPDTFRGVDTKACSQFESFRSRVESLDESD